VVIWLVVVALVGAVIGTQCRVMALGPSVLVVLLAGLGLGFVGGVLEMALHAVLGLIVLQVGFLAGAALSRVLALARLRERKARRAAAAASLAKHHPV
jgi:hypothetical protein